MAANEEPGPSWEELLGSKHWGSLLDPHNLSLCKFIIRCGEFCQATYDTFNNDQNFKFCGSSRYGKSSFFQKSFRSLFARSISRESWDRESNWIGNIASTSDKTSEALGRREIYVAWRGTTRGYEWINVFDPKLESVEPLLRDKQNDGNNSSNSGSGDENEKQPKVMFGWLTLYISDDPRSPFTKLSARAQLLGKIKELKERYKGENISIVFTGHSLGASLATLSAFDVVESGIVDDIPVGNKAFDERTKRRSPSLKELTDPSDWHVVTGWNGEI
ncbi:hypothetical protein V6N11_054970 [Hibiscus sabdariffa]|uniref:Phospholipase A1 n=1 Tax=Hibiscus sabdariffa TaxID=183260 RepID=A0ABR2P3L4_9ROSI